jgi:hypothetical protein
MRPSVLFEMQPNKENSAFAASLVIPTAEHEILPRCYTREIIRVGLRWKSHHYNLLGHFLTELLSRHVPRPKRRRRQKR